MPKTVKVLERYSGTHEGESRVMQRRWIGCLASLLFLYSTAGQAEEQLSNCVQPIQQQAYQPDSLPKIKYSSGTYWFRPDGSVLDLPKSDIRYSTNYANYQIAYFFDLQASKWYLQKRGGLKGDVDWYGPMEISETTATCLKSVKPPLNTGDI
ncbi:hypothetical protein A7981_06555 [Methylovorus sp. MM2]|uniref:hypothetical protein n=1 Tax=Methylovorus sp. MM2 TaxID=1848038 RepID=UPI0007DFAA38|nr:hypothetical protein [Methylovorus sp. MM2]OAM53077.1 hypothetical protein A7981_06555 [Methylovorus sp. MM2]